MSKNNYMTADGVAKLQQRLEYLQNERRQEVAERIKSAIALGDLSENSEYEDAKNEQAFLEGEIVSIQQTLKNVQIIEEDVSNADEVALGKTVTLIHTGNHSERTYTVVGAEEADLFAGKISNESPVGAAIIGHHVGDEVKINTPNGEIFYIIKAISQE